MDEEIWIAYWLVFSVMLGCYFADVRVFNKYGAILDLYLYIDSAMFVMPGVKTNRLCCMKKIMFLLK